MRISYIRIFTIILWSVFSTDLFSRATVQENLQLIEEELTWNGFLVSNIKRSELELFGFEYLHRIREDAFVVYSKRANLNSLPFLSKVRVLEKEEVKWKYPNSRPPNIKKSITVQVLDGQRFLKFLNEKQISFIKNSSSVFTVTISEASMLREISERVEVVYLGNESVKYMPDSKVLDLNLVPNSVAKIHSQRPQLAGQGMKVHVKEPPVNFNDIDLTGRVKSLSNSEDFNQHSTAMATIIGGSGLSSPRSRGVAKEVNIVSSNLNDFFPDSQTFYNSEQISVENHSYGTELESFYGARASAFDEHLHNNRSILTVFSAGNSGLLSNGAGKYQGIEGVSTLTGNFKMTKNTLVVGAVDTIGSVISFNSSGPAYDGRIKPELVAYSMDGTSNAAALVSGVGVILQQVYQERYGQLPSSELVKAALINGADDVHTVGPDFKTGYGNLNALRSLEILETGQFILGEINQGQVAEHLLEVGPNVAQLKITLTWNDLAANPNASKALINDLDIQIIDPDGQQHFPWVLSSDPLLLAEAATTGVDRLNNIEQIEIKNPKLGTYVIQVSGYDLQSQQSYAVAHNEALLNQFSWEYPISKTNVPYDGETTGYVRWKSTLGDEKGTLHYSIDNGESWQVVSEVNLQDGAYRWDPPQIYASAQLKMTVENREYKSDNFYISRQLNFKPAFNCTDSLRFEFQEHPGVSSFDLDLYANDQSKSNSFNTKNSISLILEDQNGLVITPRGAQGEEFISSDYLNASSFLGVCYLNSYYSEISLDTGVVIHVELGSLHQIDRVELTREEQLIASVQRSALTKSLKLIDENPSIGLNMHRVRVYFENGTSLESDQLPSYFLPPKEFLLYPNPVARSELLNILQTSEPEPNTYFELLNSKSNQLTIFELSGERNSVDISGLASGVYLYKIYGPSFNKRGKIVIQ